MDTDGDKLTKSYLNELNNGSIFYTHFPYNKMSMIASDHTNTPILTYDLGLGEDDILTSAPPPEPLLAELTDLYPTNFGPNHYCRILEKKCYELTDHLGNVRTVVTDKKLSTLSASNEPTNFIPEIKSVNNFFPGGMQQPGRNWPGNLVGNGGYRYGYQGSEKDDEITGSTGTHATTHFRELDTRLNRWWSIDPKATQWESPYATMGGNPIRNNDVLGDSIWTTTKGNVVTLHFTGKVMNQSKYKIDMEESIKDIKEDFISTYEGNFKGKDGSLLELKVDIQLSEAKTLNGVSASDHLIVFSNVEHVEGNARGIVNRIGGKIAYISAQDFPRTGSWFGMSLSNTAVHEMGHLMGLPHNDPYRKNNLMNVGADGHIIEDDQRKQIVKNTMGLGRTINVGKPFLMLSGYKWFDTNWEDGNKRGTIDQVGHTIKGN